MEEIRRVEEGKKFGSFATSRDVFFHAVRCLPNGHGRICLGGRMRCGGFVYYFTAGGISEMKIYGTEARFQPIPADGCPLFQARFNYQRKGGGSKFNLIRTRKTNT